jgi:hypothetical protein
MFSIRLLPFFVMGCASVPVPLGGIDVVEGPLPAAADLSPGHVVGSDFGAMEEWEVRASIWGSLNTLQGLQIVEVAEVILDLPAEALCAYSWTPCAGFEGEVEAALREVAPRVERLSELAERVVDSVPEGQVETCSDSVIFDNLDQLADLQIIKVGDLQVAEPERNCPYGVPCEEDIALAEQITCERAEALDRIVERSAAL